VSTTSTGHLRLEHVTDAEIVAALAALPPQAQLLVSLADVEGRSHGEIARMLGIPVAAVAAHLHRSCGHLARPLAAQSAEGGQQAARTRPA
jgi:DNA-directed RNA polymerase specialized sigma24 family protein